MNLSNLKIIVTGAAQGMGAHFASVILPSMVPMGIAMEWLFTGRRITLEEARTWGLVNRIVPRAELEAATTQLAERIATMPRLGLALTKQAINHVEDLQGKRSAMDAVFHMHHFAHAQGDLTMGNNLGGMDVKSMASANKEKPSREG